MAYPGRGDDALRLEEADHVHIEPVAPARLDEKLTVARSVPAKLEILADHDNADTEL
jgi:hypothetical protein